jgi:hypothetical protein
MKNVLTGMISGVDAHQDDGMRNPVISFRGQLFGGRGQLDDALRSILRQPIVILTEEQYNELCTTKLVREIILKE